MRKSEQKPPEINRLRQPFKKKPNQATKQTSTPPTHPTKQNKSRKVSQIPCSSPLTVLLNIKDPDNCQPTGNVNYSSYQGKTSPIQSFAVFPLVFFRKGVRFDVGLSSSGSGDERGRATTIQDEDFDNGDYPGQWDQEADYEELVIFIFFISLISKLQCSACGEGGGEGGTLRMMKEPVLAPASPPFSTDRRAHV